MLTTRNLAVKKSTLPKSGKGLFTKVFINKGEKIVEYKGRITTWEIAEHDDGKNAYIFYVSRNHVIDAKHNKSMLARFANDANGCIQMPGLKNNSKYEIENKQVFITAIKDIPPGAEILVNYGKEYWEIIKKYKL